MRTSVVSLKQLDYGPKRRPASRLLAGALIGLLACGLLSGCKSETDDSLLILSVLYFVKQRTTPPNLAWTNSSGVTVAVGLYSDSTCTTSVSGTTVSALGSGSTSSLSSFTAGTYHARRTPGTPLCSSSSFTYSNGFNYTVTASGTSYSISGTTQ